MISPDSTTKLTIPVSQSMFDYADLDTDTRVYVQERADEIRARGRRMTEDIIAIGGKLIEVKDRLGHGQFGAWLEREFQWDARMAQNFMRVYSRFKSEIISDLNIGPTILYMLAAPSVSYEVAEDVLNRARAGENVTVADVREAINNARPEPEPGMFDDGQPVLVEDYETGRPVWVNEDGEVIGVNPYDVPAPDDVPTRLYPLVASNHISASDGYDGDEWYTPAEYIEASRRVMGSIDIDPASCEIANRIVRAAMFYTKEHDGLQFNWDGRVFLNPPYSYPLVEKFTSHLIEQVDTGYTTEAILLVNNSSDTDWFQALLARYPACFTDGRVRFYRDTGEYFGTRQGQAFFYAGPNRDRFIEEFSVFGVVVEAVEA